MRVLSALAVAAVLVEFGVAAPNAVAESQMFYGLHHESQGAADFQYDPVTRRLPVMNIGSSGQDGVRIDLPNALVPGSMSQYVKFADGVVILGGNLPSTSYRELTMYSGSEAVGMLTVHKNSDESETVTADYTSSGSTRVTVFVIDTFGHRVAAQTFNSGSAVITIRGDAFAAPGSGSGERVLTAVGEKGYAVQSYGPTHRKMQIDYPGTVYVSGGSWTSVAGTSFQIHCSNGLPKGALTSLKLTAATPVGSPPGQFTLEEVGIVPPCAGCPNGPPELGMCVATGDATFDIGVNSTGDPQRTEIGNLGSSGQDGVDLRVSRRSGSDCCSVGAGYNNLFVYNSPAPRTVDFNVRGNHGPGSTEQGFGRLHIDVEPSQSAITADFTALGVTGYRVRLYAPGNQTPIADVTNPVSPVIHHDPTAVWLVQTDLQTSNGFPRIRIMCPTGCLGWPVSLNGQMFTAAEIAFELPGSGVALASGLNLTLFSLRATGGTLPFSGITVNSTIPNVAVGPGAAVAMDAAKLFPNPATDAVRVVFAVPRSATAQVTVIDLAGRQVRSLANRSFAAGAHELRWDGRDDGGREAPAGMYFVRVRSAAGESTARLSRLW